MARKLTHLKQFDIPKPCSENWEQMEGDQKRRFCGGCGCHVHNIAELEIKEAEKLLAGPGRVCTRVFTDPIRGVLTKDGWVARMLVAGAAVAAFTGCAPEIASAGQEVNTPPRAHETMGKPVPRPQVLLGDVVIAPRAPITGRLVRRPDNQTGECSPLEATHVTIGKRKITKLPTKSPKQRRAKHHASKHK